MEFLPSKIIRSNRLSVCTFKSRPNRIRGIFSFHLYVPTDPCTDIRPKKTGQLDTPKINEVMFLLHGCKKSHTGVSVKCVKYK